MANVIVRSKQLPWLYFIIFWYYMLALALEVLNGAAILYGISIVSSFVTLVKLVIFVLLSWVFLKRFLVARLSFSFVCLFVCFSALINIVNYGEYSSRTLPVLIKIFFNILSFLFFYKVIDDQFEAFDVRAIAKINSIVFVTAVGVSLFGLGFANYTNAYGEGFGGQGFFYAGNEVGAALLCCFLIMLFYFKGLSIWVTFVALLLALIVQSKVSLLGVLFISFVYLFLFHRSLFFIVALATFLSAAAIVSWILNYMQFAINRWVFLIDSYGLNSFILGGNKRVLYITDYLEKLTDNFFVGVFFGFGWSGEAENNLFDLIEAFGVVGVFLFLIWVVMLLVPIKSRTGVYERSGRNRLLSFSFGVVLLFVLVFAGHVVQSSLLTVFLGLYGYLMAKGFKNERI